MYPCDPLRQNCGIFQRSIILYPLPPPHTYLPTPLQPAYLAWPTPRAYQVSGLPPTTNPFDEVERVRKLTQAAAKKRQRAARAAKIQAAKDQTATDQAAAAAYAARERAKRAPKAEGVAAETEKEAAEPERADVEVPQGGDEAEEEEEEAETERADAEVPQGGDEAEEEEEEVPDMMLGTEEEEGEQAVEMAEAAAAAEVELRMLPEELLEIIFNYMMLERGQTHSMTQTLEVSRSWHRLTVQAMLRTPPPEGRQPLAMNFVSACPCAICYNPFSSVCRPTVMLGCEGPHAHCWDCIAKHSLCNSERTCEGQFVSCPICRMHSSGVQACGMAGGMTGKGKGPRVLLPGSVVGFAEIRRKQHGRKERDREEGMEAERRDRYAFEALQQALATAQPPLDVDLWWCTLGAEVAVLSESLTARQLQGLANHVGTLSARHVSVNIEVLSLARDDILRRCLGVEERTTDVVHRELERRAREGRLRVTAATAQAVINRRTVGGGGKRVRTQTPAFIPYS